MWKTVLMACWFMGGLCSVAISCPDFCECFIENGSAVANCSRAVLKIRNTTTSSRLSTINQHHKKPSFDISIDILNVRRHYLGYPATLSQGSFKNFPNIKYLNLSNISIETIPNGVFYGLHYIITIDLSYNRIYNLNGAVFKSLNSLQTLSLRGNPLVLTIDNIIVANNLKQLDMGDCGLQSIPSYTFANVPSLITLLLDGNQLQTINPDILPSGLSYLNLANNDIKYVPIHPFNIRMKSLIQVILGGNPIKCTCNLILLQDSFNGQGRIFGNDIVCNKPSQFAGRHLSQINENDLCSLEFIKKKEHHKNSSYHANSLEPQQDTINKITSYPAVINYIQGDQPKSSDIDSEVLHSDEKTRSYGTHMESKMDEFTENKEHLHSTMAELQSDETGIVNGEELENLEKEIEDDTLTGISHHKFSSTEKTEFEKEEDDFKLHLSVTGTVNDEAKKSTEFENLEKPTEDGKTDESVKESSLDVFSTDKTETEKEEVDDDDDDVVVEDGDSVERYGESEEEVKEHLDVSEVITSNTELHSLKTSSKEFNTMVTSSTEAENLVSADPSQPETNQTHLAESETSSNHFITTAADSSETTGILYNKEELTPVNETLSQHVGVSSDSDNHTSINDLTENLIENSDVEEFMTAVHNVSHDDKPTIMSAYIHDNTSEIHDDSSISSVDDIFNNEPMTTSGPSFELYTVWPASKSSDLADYNYDTQHDYYSSVEPLNSSLNSTDVDTSSPENRHLPLTTEKYSESEGESATVFVSTSSSPISFETIEGSGDDSNETASREEEHRSSSVLWMDEQEAETTTEDYSVESVSSTFNVSSSEEMEFSRFTSDNTSSSMSTLSVDDSTTISPESTSETSEGDTEETTMSSPEESTTEASPTTEEESSSTDGITSEDTTISLYDNGTITSVSSEDTTVYSTTEEVTTSDLLGTDIEQTTTEEVSSSTDSSSTSGDILLSSSSSSSSLEISSESSSTSEATTEEEITETSTDSSSSSVIPIIIPDLDDDKERETKDDESSSSSTTGMPLITSEITGDTDLSSSSIEHSTSEVYNDSLGSSAIPVVETEIIKKTVHADEKENIITMDPTREEMSEEKSTDELDATKILIIIGAVLIVIAIILISLLVIYRRSRRPQNIRLPADPEANIGTEMQDMLLPKPTPENGVKVVPKNYTNGTTNPTEKTANGNGSSKPLLNDLEKEEEIPVLSAAAGDDEDANIPTPADDNDADEPLAPEWDNKPEPIETVTARLTMLARPQTPVYIPNTIN